MNIYKRENMVAIVIFCIITCGNFVFLKVSSSKERVLFRPKVDTNLENAMDYVIDYCSNEQNFLDYDHKYQEKNILTSNDINRKCQKDDNFIMSMCQLVKHGTGPLQGTTICFSVKETSKQLTISVPYANLTCFKFSFRFDSKKPQSKNKKEKTITGFEEVRKCFISISKIK